MKVKTLINKLSKFNPDADIRIEVRDGWEEGLYQIYKDIDLVNEHVVLSPDYFKSRLIIGE